MNRIKAFLLLVAIFFTGWLCAIGQAPFAFVALTLFLVALGIGYQPGLCRLNTLTSLAPDIYAALDVVSRELIGFIPAVARDPRADRVAKGVTFRSPITEANTTATTTTPAMAIPSAQYQTVDQATLTMANYIDAGFSWTGEEEKYIESGPGFTSVLQDQFAQCFRAIANSMELAIAQAVALNASRATGTAGTTPFDSSNAPANGQLLPMANVRRILDDNGAPGAGVPGARTLVINTLAGANIRSLLQLTRANEAADTDLLRKGTLLNIHGIDIKESAQVVPVAAVGTASGATTDGSAYAVGATTITLASAGTGTILAGDVITFAGDTTDKTHYYVVKTGNTGVNVGGTIVLQNPGLMKAIPASTKAITVQAQFSPNVAFSRNAVLLATRLQALPSRGDLATDRMTVADPVSGINFEIAYYPGFRMGTYKVLVAYGVSVIKPEHTAMLLG